jgi:hypothetical protein
MLVAENVLYHGQSISVGDDHENNNDGDDDKNKNPNSVSPESRAKS